MLYKYRKFRSRGVDQVRQLILNQELWLSKASELNDDYDCYPIITIPEDRADLHRSLIRMMLEHPDKFPRENRQDVMEYYLANDCHELRLTLNAAASDVRERIGVLSLSIRSDISKLWIEYSDNFRGVCFGFNDDDGEEKFFSNARKVRYFENRPTFEWRATFSTEEQEKCLLEKTSDWSDEQEARLLGVGVWGAKRYPSSALKEVVFGQKCNQYNRQKVKRWLAEVGHEVKFFEATAVGDGVNVSALRT